MHRPEPPCSEAEPKDEGKPGLFRRLWQGLSYFLVLIGLRRPRRVANEALLARLRHHYAQFRRLLTANDSFLNILSLLNRHQREAEAEDLVLLEQLVLQASVDVFRMVESLHAISGEYPALARIHRRISGELARLFESQKATQRAELVLSLSRIDQSRIGQVGRKMANLGEIRSRLHLPTPDGFVVTIEAYRRIAESCGALPWLRRSHWMAESGAEEPEVASLAQRLAQAPLTAELSEAIGRAFDHLAESLGVEPVVAVRSSAMGEDGRFSHAGQYLTVLGVTRASLPGSYSKVLASLFCPEAVHYREAHRIPHEFAAMAVGVIQMVEARASGVVFTEDPGRPDAESMLIHAVHGLGASLVEGSLIPEAITVNRRDGGSISRRPARPQAAAPGSASDEAGIDPRSSPAAAGSRVLSDEEALQLHRMSLEIERHFGSPQDIEWAIDRDGRILILQSRPLRFSQLAVQGGPPEPGATLLLDHGEIACPGVGVGPAVFLDETQDMDGFPEGGVLVVRRSSPKFVRVMQKAAAIVADAGSTVGHMASLARELEVPTILGSRDATRKILPGQIITVDALKGYVYAGEVDSLRQAPRETPARAMEGAAEGPIPVSAVRAGLNQLLTRLTLTDPRSPLFEAENCATLHDLARFVHEKCYEEMFRKGEGLGQVQESCAFLDVFLPIDLYVIDLGGGLKPGVSSRQIKPADIASVPLEALLRGMLDPRLPRFGPRPMDVKGLFSIMARHAINNPEQERTFWEPSYVLASDRYMNYTARVGYHFSVVDAYCGKTPTKNYISFLFRGGAADLLRRGRRARALANILKESGFLTEVKEDSAFARIAKSSQEETARQLEMIGRLFQFARQMDIAMVSERSMELFEESFLKGDFSFARPMAEDGPSGED
ncbi:MAG: hypothetical protein HY815_16390 [Candidatus Riflebacteria bacterium]|nr:hypothetical protein [Candidatus Riflebacteria bacterium]